MRSLLRSPSSSLLLGLFLVRAVPNLHAQGDDRAILGAVLPHGALVRDYFVPLDSSRLRRARELVSDSACLESLRVRTGSRAPFDSSLARFLGVRLVSRAEADSLRRGATFSYTLYSVSRPAISADARQAVVYVAATCGPLCGVGQLVLLEWTGQRWRISRNITLWIS